MNDGNMLDAEAIEQLQNFYTEEEWKLINEEEPVMQYFKFGHLPEKLQVTSAAFFVLAIKIFILPKSSERTVALRKLLEAKDAAVRATL